MPTIEQQLDDLAEAKARLDLININYTEQRNKILEVVKDQLDALDAETKPLTDYASDKITRIEAEVKVAVIAAKGTVKGKYLQAVYMSPRVSWNTKGLEGYSVAHPEISAFRSYGEASAQIRSIK